MSYLTLIGNETPENKIYRTQVFKATHDGGDNRLPFMYRSFISFTYGGKIIEDFGLIAITESNSIDRKLSADFKDYITEQEVVHGQLYWGTSYNSNRLDLALFTDEITEKQLVSFSQWFRAGIARELILSEHPNRAIMARLESPPEYHMLPFEKNFNSTMTGEKTSTTVYKGKINITFIMDDPFWYAKYNILSLNGDEFNINGKIATKEDILKIAEEDGTPLSGSVMDNILIGKNVEAKVSKRPARIWDDNDNIIDNPEAYIGAVIGGISTLQPIDGPHLSTLNKNTKAYFYYPGTAPSYPIIKFTMPILYNGNYISSPKNKYVGSTPYNTITIASTLTKKFRFTTPSVLTAYNQAVKIITSNSNLDEEELVELLRDGVNHYKVRAVAVLSKGNIGTIQNAMPREITFEINCKNGETKIMYNFDGEQIEDAGDAIRSDYLTIEDRNYPNASGYIDRTDSHYIEHDVEGGLSQIYFNYDYMYL